MPDRTTDLIRRAYRGEIAHRHVVALSGYHRIQASPGYRAAAGYVAGQLQAAGVQVAVRTYPADGVARFWTSPSFLEWACDASTLHLLDDQGSAAELLCDFEAIPTSLVQRSISAAGEFEVVVPGGKGGAEVEDYAGLDVRGKVVLTDQRPSNVAAVAVSQLGAAGILCDGMKAGGRSELDLPDARQYTSFWWAGFSTPDAWGFVLSPRQGRDLRARLAKGETVRVRADIDSRFYAGSFEVVDAFIPGSDPAAGEILLVSHLCHPRPGAHDNGSGAAALIEVAATLARLIQTAACTQPRRGIRCLWPPEMTGTFAWLAEHEAGIKAGRWLAGLNLDMVGADQCQTGSVWELGSLPLAGASFADHLLSWLREPFLDGQRHCETPFSAGSDHYILSDPTVGIPTPMHQPMARQVLPHLGRHAGQGEPRQPGPQRRAGRCLCLLAGSRGRGRSCVARPPHGHPACDRCRQAGHGRGGGCAGRRKRGRGGPGLGALPTRQRLPRGTHGRGPGRPGAHRCRHQRRAPCALCARRRDRGERAGLGTDATGGRPAGRSPAGQGRVAC